MEPDYGSDLLLADGFEPHFPEGGGRANLVRAIFRRLTTSATGEAGRGIYAGRCLDLRDLFAARLDASRLGPIGRQVEDTCLFDDRIEAAACKPVFNFARRRLEVGVNLTPAAGPSFPLVLGVTAVTVEILSEAP